MSPTTASRGGRSQPGHRPRGGDARGATWVAWPSSPAPDRASGGPRHDGWPPKGRPWRASISAEDAIEAVAAEINGEAAEAGGRAIAVRCDVTRRGRRRLLRLPAAGDELGPITNLCNIAGIGGFAHTPEQSLSGWDKIIAVNLTGTFLMCRAVLPGMLEHGGAIVNTVSTAGIIGQPYSAAYCASKGGVKLLTKALAVEYMARGVRVNGVAPGGVDTPIIHNFGPPEDADFKLIERLMTPIGFAYPHEIAGAFAYLGSHEADYITGAILSIDGAITT